MSKPVKIVLISSVCLVVTLAIVLGCVFGIKCTVTFYSDEPFYFASDYPSGGIIWKTNTTLSTKATRLSTLSLEPPKSFGNTFAGWYKDSALTVPWLSTDKVTSNITLYAKWEAE